MSSSGYRDDPDPSAEDASMDDEGFVDQELHDPQLEDIDLPDGAAIPRSYTNENNRKCSKLRMFLPCILFLVSLTALVAVSHKRGNNNGTIAAHEITTLAQKEQDETQNTLFSTPKKSQFNGPKETNVGRIVEFTVANLTSDASYCSYIHEHQLECSASNSTTNKFRVQLHPTWAPIGVKRFEELTSSGFWEDVRIFRVVNNFMSQFGLSSDVAVQKQWMDRGFLPDDPVVGTNYRGTVSFATSGDNSRTTQVFINTANNYFLDKKGFSPIGEVLPAGYGYGGMDVVDAFYGGYGEKPDQGKIHSQGGEYLEKNYPKLSHFVKAEFVD